MLQVQLQDAFKAEADTVIERLKDELRKASIDYTDMTRNDPQIDCGGRHASRSTSRAFRPTKAGNFRQIVTDNFGTHWILTPVNQTDYRMTMKPS